MKICLLTFWLFASCATCLLGQSASPDPPVEAAYRTECFVVNHTPHPIHLAFYDADRNLCARDSDDLVQPGDSLSDGVWWDPSGIVNPLDSVDIVITSDKRKWVLRSVLMRETPSVQEIGPRRRNVYYFVEWSQTASDR